MVIEIDLKELKSKLIEIYTNYISDDYEKHERAIKLAKELDGLWSGSFLLPKSVERAINALTYLYVKPKISKEMAKEILMDLKKEL